MLEKSLREYGAGRSVLVDKAGRIIAGNKTIEAAGSIGLEDALMVETDGTQVVIVKRTDLDLDSPQGRGLAIADNRVAEVGLDWDMEALEKLGEELELDQFWFVEELDQMNIGSPLGDALVEVESYKDDLAERFQAYDDAEIKQITLLFSSEDYEVAIGMLGEVCEKLSAPDFSAAVMELLHRATTVSYTHLRAHET